MVIYLFDFSSFKLRPSNFKFNWLFSSLYFLFYCYMLAIKLSLWFVSLVSLSILVSSICFSLYFVLYSSFSLIFLQALTLANCRYYRILVAVCQSGYVTSNLLSMLYLLIFTSLGLCLATSTAFIAFTAVTLVSSIGVLGIFRFLRWRSTSSALLSASIISLKKNIQTRVEWHSLAKWPTSHSYNNFYLFRKKILDNFAVIHILLKLNANFFPPKKLISLLSNAYSLIHYSAPSRSSI